MSHGESIEEVVDRFLAHKRALGRKYTSAQSELQLLVRFCAERGMVGLGQLTPALLDEFLASRPRSRPKGFNHLLCVVRCLLDWAVAQQLLEVSPLRARRRRVTSQPIPYILDQQQVRRLLDAAGALPDNARARGRAATCRTIFALCYGLGLRAGEASRLRVGDVDVQRRLLIVRGGKFGKSRLVPHGPRIAALLDQQLERRRRAGPLDEQAPLFTFDGVHSISSHRASQTFHELVLALDLPVPAGVSPPNCAASGTASPSAACCAGIAGADRSARLHQLSTFMGHVDPSSTQVYLTITPALLEQANRRFERFAEPVWTEAQR